MEHFRRCRKCGMLQVITEFYPHSRNNETRQHTCRTCSKADAKRWRDENRERFTELRWRREIQAKYGITADDYERMLEAQGGVCAGCGSESPGMRYSRVFQIDHCHQTGKVRGLLCGGCNMALGQLEEDGDRLRSLARYADEVCKPLKYEAPDPDDPEETICPWPPTHPDDRAWWISRAQVAINTIKGEP